MLSPRDYVSISSLPKDQIGQVKSSKEVGENWTEGDDTRAWLSAEELLKPGGSGLGKDTMLSFYTSSEWRNRCFCSNCGTGLFYFVSEERKPKEWPSMVDVVLGTVDRGLLEGEALRPERQLWWGCGVDWIRDLVERGAGERHPGWKANEVVK